MPDLYRIRDWNAHYETAESRKYKTLGRYVATPNKQGRGYRRIVMSQDGAAVFGAWNAIIQLASRMPERGVLRREDGPLSLSDIAVEILMPEDLVSRTVQLMCSKSFEWMELLPGESPGESIPTGRISRQTDNHQENLLENSTHITINNLQETKRRRRTSKKAQEQVIAPPPEPPPAADLESEKADRDRIGAELKAFIEHLSGRAWHTPDRSICGRALRAIRMSTVEQAAEFLEKTAYTKRPAGARAIEVRSYAFAVRLLADEFGGPAE